MSQRINPIPVGQPLPLGRKQDSIEADGLIVATQLEKVTEPKSVRGSVRAGLPDGSGICGASTMHSALRFGTNRPRFSTNGGSSWPVDTLRKNTSPSHVVVPVI